MKENIGMKNCKKKINLTNTQKYNKKFQNKQNIKEK
jgi:hypothetical protein